MSTFVYKFKSEPDKIDFQRICDENMEDGRLAFVTTFERCEFALLFVHNSIYRRFEGSDNKILNGTLLCKYWGLGLIPRLKYAYPRLNLQLSPALGPDRLACWRWDIIHLKNIKAVKEELNAITQEQKSVTVRIHDLTEEKPCREESHAPYKYLFGDRVQRESEVYTIVGVERSCGKFIYETVPDSSLSPQYFSEEALDKNFKRLPEKLSKYKIGDLLGNWLMRYKVVDVFYSQHSKEYVYELEDDWGSILRASEEEIETSALKLHKD